MKWISIKDKKPNKPGIIVAIMHGRIEQNGDPIEDALIVILRNQNKNGQWYSMDCTDIFFDDTNDGDYYHTIKYWLPWNKFEFPSSMIIDDIYNQPERSKREDSQKCEMRCSEHCGNTVREAQ